MELVDGVEGNLVDFGVKLLVVDEAAEETFDKAEDGDVCRVTDESAVH